MVSDDGVDPEQELNPVELYRLTLKQVWLDGILTDEEKLLMNNLQRILNISDTEHALLEEQVKKDLEFVAKNTYQIVLEQAWQDGIVTEDEADMLESLRKGLNISEELHEEMEDNLKEYVQERMASIKSSGKGPMTEDTPEYWIAKGENLWRNSAKDREAALEAMSYFDKAIDLDPLNFLAWSNKGLILKKLNRKEDAIACYDKALEINSEFPNAWFNKGILLGTIGKVEEAISCLDEVLRLKPDNKLAQRDKEILMRIHKKQQADAEAGG